MTALLATTQLPVWPLIVAAVVLVGAAAMLFMRAASSHWHNRCVDCCQRCDDARVCECCRRQGGEG